MKIRQGFVSNSSSSSFVLAYKKGDIASEFYKTLKLKLDDSKHEFYELSPSDLIEDEKRKVEELSQGIEWIKEQIGLYENFIKDQKNIDAIGLIVRIVQGYENKRMRWANGHKISTQLHKEHPYDAKKDLEMDVFIEKYITNEEVIFKAIDGMKYNLKRMDNDIKKITDRIKLLEPYTIDNSWIIFSANVSYGERLELIMKESVEDGTFKKIEWKNT